jgi:25S rRNA (uracil2634-N3)-methyltransferase
MAKSKKPLKAALQSQQSWMKMKQKASQAAQTAELMTKKHTKGKLSVAAKGKGKEIVPPRHPTIPFRPTDNILLIGEGNFSFARALVSDAPTQLEHLPPKNITATSYDTEQECYDKYPEAVEIVQGLKAAGVKVLFGIDATQLSKVAAFKGKKWDRIVWNFPHAGMPGTILVAYIRLYITPHFTGKGITDQDRNILSNQLLILGFLRSAAGFLVNGSIPEIFSPRKRKRPDDDDGAEEDEDMGDSTNLEDSNIAQAAACRGTILITLRNVVPYTQW